MNLDIMRLIQTEFGDLTLANNKYNKNIKYKTWQV